MKSIHYTAITYLMISAFSMHAMGTKELITPKGGEGCQFVFPVNNNNNNNNQITGQKRAAEETPDPDEETPGYDTPHAMDFARKKAAGILKRIKFSLATEIDRDLDHYNTRMIFFNELKNIALQNHGHSVIVNGHMNDSDRLYITDIVDAGTLPEIVKILIQSPTLNASDKAELQAFARRSTYDQYATYLATKIVSKRTQYFENPMSHDIATWVESDCNADYGTLGITEWFHQRLQQDVVNTYCEKNRRDGRYVRPIDLHSQRKYITTLTNAERASFSPKKSTAEDATQPK